MRWSTQHTVVPMLDHDIVGLEILVAVDAGSTGTDLVPAFGYDAVFMGLPDGSASVLLSARMADGLVWGTTDLAELEAKMRRQ